MAGKRVIFMRNAREVGQYFDVAAPMLTSCVQEFSRGEFTMEDLRQQCECGEAVCALMFDDGAPVLACAWKPVHYPRYTSIHMLAIGGENLLAMCAHFMGAFKDYCRQSGAVAIEANCRPSMVRLLQALGFVPVSQVVRCEI